MPQRALGVSEISSYAELSLLTDLAKADKDREPGCPSDSVAAESRHTEDWQTLS